MNYKIPDWRYELIKNEVAKVFIECNIVKIPITGFEIASKLGIAVVPYSAFCKETKNALINEDEDGFCIKRKGKYYIYYNDEKIYGRINFTILHEIGHIVLDHTQHSKLAEAEANFFAKYAIAPPVLVEKYSVGLTAFNILLNIYELFDVTETSGYNCWKYYLKWKRNYNRINQYTDYEEMILKQFE